MSETAAKIVGVVLTSVTWITGIICCAYLVSCGYAWTGVLVLIVGASARFTWKAGESKRPLYCDELIATRSSVCALSLAQFKPGDIVVIKSVNVAPIDGSEDYWRVSYELTKDKESCKPSS